MMMASCHTVVPEKDSDGEFNYQSSSPDEGALVRGANDQGFVFCARRPREIVVKTVGGEGECFGGDIFKLYNCIIDCFFSRLAKSQCNY